MRLKRQSYQQNCALEKPNAGDTLDFRESGDEQCDSKERVNFDKIRGNVGRENLEESSKTCSDHVIKTQWTEERKKYRH